MKVADSQFGLFLETSRPQLDPRQLCSDEERAVAAALQWGRAGARQVGAIAAEADVPARKTQTLIEHLILDHRWPIGTSMGQPAGNYLIDTAEDLEATVALLRTRGISTLQRAAALKRMTLEEFLRHVQTTLDLGGN